MSVIPTKHRDAIRVELDALARGERPEFLTWVEACPAELVRQPELIWSHAQSELVQRADGTLYGVLPLWTAEEAPSDLSVELDIDQQGIARICDVRVL